MFVHVAGERRLRAVAYVLAATDLPRWNLSVRSRIQLILTFVQISILRAGIICICVVAIARTDAGLQLKMFALLSKSQFDASNLRF